MTRQELLRNLWPVFCRWLAGVLPDDVVYECAVRMVAYGNSDGTASVLDVLKRWKARLHTG